MGAARETVTLLLTFKGEVVSVYRDAASAVSKRDAYNADPFIDEETADVNAPYSVATWSVRS